MEDRQYITDGKAWLTAGETGAVPSTPPVVTDQVLPRLCKCGCGRELPATRKSFYDKACQGAWLGTHHKTPSRIAPEGKVD